MLGVSITELRKHTQDYFDYVWNFDKELLIFNAKKHEYLYFEFPEKGGQVGIRFGNWKGVRTNVKKDIDAAWQLFDLSNDLSETKDIAGEHPAVIKKMQAIEKEAHRHSHIREWEFIDPKFNEKK